MALILRYRLSSGPIEINAQTPSPTTTAPAINHAVDGPPSSSRRRPTFSLQSSAERPSADSGFLGSSPNMIELLPGRDEDAADARARHEAAPPPHDDTGNAA